MKRQDLESGHGPGSVDTQQPRILSLRLLLIAVCGNVLEWYDFAVYGYFAIVLSKQFFPPQNPVAALLATFGIFAVGFFGRIGGGFFYGLLSDRCGRVRALQLSVLLMAGSTTMMGMLPVYAQVGLLAPILLTLLRLFQGLSVGGEFATSMTLLAEEAVPERRGWSASWCGAAASAGFLLGSAAGTILSIWLTSETLLSWGWRLPFLFGSVLGIIAITVRRQLAVIDIIPSEPASISHILKQLWREQRKSLLITVAGTCLYMVAFYVPFVYLATGIETQSRFSMSSALELTSTALILLVILTPLGGWLADRAGTRRLLIISSAALAVLSVPLFELVKLGNPLCDTIVMLVFVVLYAPLNAVALLPLTLQFPHALRGTAFAVSFNIAAAVFGGLSPLIADWLVNITGSLSAPGWMLAAAAIISLFACRCYPDMRRGLDNKG
jgi:MFS transporter, MHS family, proline/betaine transporter